MKSPSRALRGLLAHLDELQQKFLKPYLGKGTLTPDANYTLDVNAFIVLSHAAFEDFFEQISLWVFQKTKSQFLKGQGTSKATVALLWHSRQRGSTEEGQDEAFYDRIRKNLDELAKDISKTIIDNHGISKRHLRELLWPLGIDLSADQQRINSLEHLVSLRGERAHHARVGAKVVASAEDAQKIVDDCIIVARFVRAQSILVLRPKRRRAKATSVASQPATISVVAKAH